MILSIVFAGRGDVALTGGTGEFDEWTMLKLIKKVTKQYVSNCAVVDVTAVN